MGKEVVGQIGYFSGGGSCILKIGGVGKNQIKPILFGVEIQKTEDFHLLNASSQAGELQILSNQTGCGTMMFHKDCGIGPSAQGLDAKGTAARKQVEHAGLGNPLAQ
jgi:hypothetical protein